MIYVNVNVLGFMAGIVGERSRICAFMRCDTLLYLMDLIYAH